MILMLTELRKPPLALALVCLERQMITEDNARLPC